MRLAVGRRGQDICKVFRIDLMCNVRLLTPDPESPFRHQRRCIGILEFLMQHTMQLGLCLLVIKTLGRASVFRISRIYMNRYKKRKRERQREGDSEREGEKQR